MPEHLVELGSAYWQFDVVDQFGNPDWSFSASELATDGLGAIQHIAAAAVRAVVADATCDTCGRELVARTRTDVMGVLAGGQATCVPCDSRYVTAVIRMRAALDGDRYRRVVSERTLGEAERAWNGDRLATIREHYKVELSADHTPPIAPCDASVIILAILRFCPFDRQAPGLIHPAERWTTPLVANTAGHHDAVVRALRADLMAIYPSGLNTFVFEPKTFQDALVAAGGELEKIGPAQLTGSFYPLKASYYVPYGPSMGTAVERLDAHLVRRLALPALTDADRLGMLGMLAQAIAAEAVRYFNHQIEWNSLPPVPEEHAPRLYEAALKAAEYMPLGRLYAQAWRAAKDGAAAAHRHRLPNSARMSTHAVNQFERFVADRTQLEGKPYGEVDAVPLAAVTRVLFRTVLDADPMATTVEQVRDQLAAVELPDDGTWAWTIVAEDVHKAVVSRAWPGRELRAELRLMREQWGPVRAWLSQVRVTDRLAGHFDLHARGANQEAAALEALDLAVLLARAGGDDARAAQRVLLRLADAVAAYEKRSADDRDAQSQAAEATASQAVVRADGERTKPPPRPARKAHSKRKKRKR